MLPGIEQIDIDSIQTTLCRSATRKEKGIDVFYVFSRVQADGTKNYQANDPKICRDRVSISTIHRKIGVGLTVDGDEIEMRSL